MRRATGVMALTVVAFFLLASPVAQACGDKLLSIARGIRLQQAYKARHPASILMYIGDAANEDTSKARNALVQLGLLYMSLRQAGHQLEVVENANGLGLALGSGRFDFVVTDVRDVAAVADQVSRRASGADVLPVLFKPSKADFAAAQQQYKLVLKTPATSVVHLEAIDQAMKSRTQGASSGY